MEAVAGAVAGMATTVVMHPLDLAKVRMQVGNGRSLGEILQFLWKHPHQAYRGLLPNLVGNAAGWGVYFWLYGRAKEALERNGKPNAGSYWLASFGSGILTQAATNPIWVVKTVMLATNTADGPVNSWAAIKQISKADGLAGFWRGFVPGIGGTIQSALHFSIYDSVKPWLQGHFPNSPDLARYLAASGISKVIAATALYPHQVLRAEMQYRRMGLLAALRLVYKQDGLKGFYRGLSANLLRVVPAMGITMAVYEMSMDFVRPPPSSS